MKIRRSFLAMGLVAATAALPVFGASGGIVSPTAGTVAVNGRSVIAGSAILAGDLVTTSPKGSANLVLPGGSVIAASNTNFRLVSVNSTTQIKLNQGLVKVAGSLPVALNSRTVIPATANGSFNVYDLSGKVYVEAVRGNVNLVAAHSTYTVHAGEIATFADGQAGAGSAPAAGASAGSGVGIVGITAAAVATGLAAAMLTTSLGGGAPGATCTSASCSS